MQTFLAALAWCQANWEWLAFGAIIILSLANKFLPGHPVLAGFARRAVDILVLIPMPGAKSAALLWLAGKIGPNAAGQFFDWLSKYFNIPLSPSVPAAAPPADVQEASPRGSVLFVVLYVIVGLTVVGICASHGHKELAAFFFVLFGGLLALFMKSRASVLILLAITVTQPSCAAWHNFWASNRGVQLAGDIASCASQACTDAIGPLVSDLVEAALHGDAVQWPDELERLVGQAREFGNCLKLAALHAVLASPLHAIAGEGGRPIGFKSSTITAGAQDSAGASPAAGNVAQGFAEPHSALGLSLAQERLRAALNAK